MFDAISVSERTRKPWTVAVSFLGQTALLGLAILVPLVSTDALPHRLTWVGLPSPPRGIRPRPAQAAVRQAPAVPFQANRPFLALPRAIPAEPVVLVDSPEVASSSADVVGVPGGFGDPTGRGNGVIDSLLTARATPVAPPMPAAKPVPPPAALTRIRLGGTVVQGKLISGPRPIYPVLAKQARIAGTVRLEAVISREGTILNLRVVSGHPLLVPAALAAVERWTFQPTSLNGDPVEVATEIDVNFTLQN